MQEERGEQVRHVRYLALQHCDGSIGIAELRLKIRRHAIDSVLFGGHLIV